MAQRRSQRRMQDPSTQAANGSATVRPEPELIVIARQEAGVRATAAGPRSATGAEVAGLANVFSAAGATLRPLFGASEERLAPAPALRRGPGEELPNLAVYYRVVAPEERLDELAEALREQESVEAASVKPPAELLRLNDMLPREESPPITPDLTSRQGYLASAPGALVYQRRRIVRVDLRSERLSLSGIHSGRSLWSDRGRLLAACGRGDRDDDRSRQPGRRPFILAAFGARPGHESAAADSAGAKPAIGHELLVEFPQLVRGHGSPSWR